MKKQLLSIVLTLCMALSLLPTAAWAEGETNSIQIGQVTLESGGIYVPASENTDPNKGTASAGNPDASIRVVDRVTAAPADGGYLTCDGTTVTVHGAVVLPDGTGTGIVASGAVTLNTGTRGTDSLTLTMTSGGSALTVNDGGTLTLTGGGVLSLEHNGSTPAVYGSFSNPGSLTTSGFTGDIAITSANGGAVQNLASVDLTTTGALTLVLYGCSHKRPLMRVYVLHCKGCCGLVL